jgi:hypothetical protein
VMRSTATKYSEERYSAESSAMSTVTIVREKRPKMDEDLGGSVNGLTIGKVCPAAGTGP